MTPETPPRRPRARSSATRQVALSVVLIVAVGAAATYLYSGQAAPPPAPAPPADAPAIAVRPEGLLEGLPHDHPGLARPDLLADLPDAVQAAVRQEATETPCPCGCEMALLVCYETDPNCHHSPPALQSMIEKARDGASDAADHS